MIIDSVRTKIPVIKELLDSKVDAGIPAMLLDLGFAILISTINGGSNEERSQSPDTQVSMEEEV